MENKNILTIETSLGRIFLAVMRGSKYFSKTISSPKSIEQDINLLLKDLIYESKIEYNDIDMIYVSLGPGSFTGIRIGIAVAKAIALCTKAKIFGFSNFESIFEQMFAIKPELTKKKIQIIIKGPGDEFFKKNFNCLKAEKQSYVIREKELVFKSSAEKSINVGNFKNTFKIKNYHYCIPDKFGFVKLIEKMKKNSGIEDLQEPTPIYVKEHYAKKK
ncbi:MAG: tRNA (adenosine(37)-N6)-threonylcarbamoyltransferase complex dimerization subunit type 1 TsaB [Pseudomonadota bacterium]|nr:tRNA (adenosine(37)-N6)-threonylcarbamoyltransferase complex dimerization subunit type 1 TsaB [Pseudomonadota bacterium]